MRGPREWSREAGEHETETAMVRHHDSAEGRGTRQRTRCSDPQNVRKEVVDDAAGITGRSAGQTAMTIRRGPHHRGECGQAQERVRVGPRPCSSPAWASRQCDHAYIDRVIVVAAAGACCGDTIPVVASQNQVGKPVIVVIMVGTLAVVMVTGAAEMNMGAVPMIGAWLAVGCCMSVGHRHRSNHEMGDKQQKHQRTNHSHPLQHSWAAVKAAKLAATLGVAATRSATRWRPLY